MAAFTSLVGIAVVYQNCAPTPSGEAPWHSVSAPYSFAYEVQPDQIAYMSCSQVKAGADASAYFTLRMGAYRSGGLRLSEEFSEKTSRMTVAQKEDSLILSEAHSDTRLQMAIRGESNLQQILVYGGGAKKGVHYSPVFAPLGTISSSQWLVENEGKWTRYLPGELGLGDAMEGSVIFSETESLANTMREHFRIGGGLLTWTFQEGLGSDNHFARAAEFGAGTAVYGRGLHLEFKKPVASRFGSSSVHTNVPSRVLSAVTEVDLRNTSQPLEAKNWVCPEQLTYMVIRNPAQAAIEGCRMNPDPPTMSSELRIARNSLRVEDWYIDQKNGCIVSKKDRSSSPGQDCYGYDTDGVHYNLAEDCSVDGNPAGKGSCAHFVSICYLE